MSELVLSYSLTLPQSLYPHLDYLFSTNRRLIKGWLSELWNQSTLNRLKERASALTVLKRDIKRTEKWIPSRVYRNSLELAGEILRSHIKRKEIYDFTAHHPCSVMWSAQYLAAYLKKSPLFVANIQRQVLKQIKKGFLEKDYFRAVRPDFSGDVFITAVDDSLTDGQFRKLRFYLKHGIFFMELWIKLPSRNQSFRWFRVTKRLPQKIAELLRSGAEPKAPVIKREKLKSGYSIYRLVLPMKISINSRPNHQKRVLSVDLSPGTNRLAVATVVEENGHSKPVFFRATRMIKKLERLRTEIDRLEKKIDHIADDIHSTSSRLHRERLKERLKHLYQEQKRRHLKFKRLRKQILEILTNWIVHYARSYGCSAIAIERLGFKGLPPAWRSKKSRRAFSLWFYRRIAEKLDYKAEKHGIRVLAVNPAHTSTHCHICGRKGRLNKLHFECQCGTYDRDYNASVNIGKRAIQVLKQAGRSKSRGQCPKDTPARNPFRQGLASFRCLLSVLPLTLIKAYSSVVEVSTMKLKNLSRWTGLLNCGYG